MTAVAPAGSSAAAGECKPGRPATVERGPVKEWCSDTPSQRLGLFLLALRTGIWC